MKKSSPQTSGPSGLPELYKRPIIVVLAGPNGAGKSTFYEAHLKFTGLRFINTDVLSLGLGLTSYEAAEVAAKLRQELVSLKESFIFETVFSDPVGDKLSFLRQAAQQGYTVVMCFIGIADAARSDERVAMRVSQGGHDVPIEKLITRFPRTMANLKQAIHELPCVLVFDNDDLIAPFRLVAVYQNGSQRFVAKSIPDWFQTLL